MTKRLIALCLAAGMLASCGGAGTARRATPAPALHDPIGFPLYAGATLVATRSFTQMKGDGKYGGHEVVAASDASFETLAAWVERINAAPPAGYIAEENQSNPDQLAESRRYGIDYALFKKRDGKTTRGVLLVVMDPQRVNRRFGTILSLIGKYKALPPFLRTPIDNEAKDRFGMTISQAMQPDSPVGAALAALGELEHRDARGILVLDAKKI